MKSKCAALIAAGLVGACLCGASNAAVVEFSFSQVITPPSVAMAGAAPWLNVKIADTATPGTVSVTIAASLIGAQTLTGIWLNAPTVAAGVTGFTTTDTDGNGTGEDPMVFAVIDANPTNAQSAFHTTQNLHPGAATKAQVGDYNILLRFANSAGSAFQGNETETFNLVANTNSGLTASSFLFRSSQTAGGLPKPPFYALASFTNADGASGNPGSGIAYIAAIPVPEPGVYALMLAGLVWAGFVSLRSGRQ
jgi:hypothetical protein